MNIPEGQLMANRSSLGAVDWDRTYLWSVQFSGSSPNETPPSPFNNFFPAVDVNYPVIAVDDYTIEAHIAVLAFPKAIPLKNMSITFYDSEGILKKWFQEWVSNSMFPNFKGVSPLKKCIRKCTIRHFTAKRKLISEEPLWVYPNGNMPFAGDQASSALIYSVGFRIVSSVRDAMNV